MKPLRIAGPAILLACALLFPWLFPDPSVTTIAIFTFLFAGAAIGWNLFSGYTGYISLGHAAFYGLGAYTLALVCKAWTIPGGYIPLLFLPLAGLIAGLFAVPMGWIALRTRRHTFVVITIAMFYVFQLLAYNLAGITNGSAGIYLPNPPWSADVFNVPFYYVSLSLLLMALGVSWWIRHSKFGLGLLAIRDDEDRALSLGVRTGASKMGAYVLSAVFAGIVGALHAYYIGNIYPSFAFDPVFDISVALMAFLGGVGTLSGPLLGAIVLEPLQQYLTLQYGGNGVDLFIYGILFLVVILLLPVGVVPTLRQQWTHVRARMHLLSPSQLNGRLASMENPEIRHLPQDGHQKEHV